MLICAPFQHVPLENTEVMTIQTKIKVPPQCESKSTTGTESRDVDTRSGSEKERHIIHSFIFSN